MANYLTVDGGTTNTRIYLVRNGRVEDTQKLSVGARNGADALKKATASGVKVTAVECIVTPSTLEVTREIPVHI